MIVKNGMLSNLFVDFHWVDGDNAEVQVQLSNPMPDELNLAHLGLITDSLNIETFPCTPSIPAEHNAYQANVRIRPTQPGDLKILGKIQTFTHL